MVKQKSLPQEQQQHTNANQYKTLKLLEWKSSIMSPLGREALILVAYYASIERGLKTVVDVKGDEPF